MKLTVLFINYLFLSSSFLFAQDGTLDSGFGTGGIVTTFINNATGAGSVVIQPDGKIIVAGYCHNGSYDVFAVVRYNVNGSLDNSFGPDLTGIVKTSIGPANAYASSVTIQSDGNIVVAGHALGYAGTNGDIAVVRYTSTGALDNTFGTGGIVMTAVGPVDDIANCVAIQSDGKIIVAGSAQMSAEHNSYDFAVVRYNGDGTLDGGFGAGGKVTTAIGLNNEVANSLAIQSDGQIVVVGTVQNASSTSNDMAIVRYNSDGTLDLGFGTGGKVTTAIPSAGSSASSVAVQLNAKIVVAGGSGSGYAVVRYNSDGTLDGTFGTGGIATTAVGEGGSGGSIALQLDGKIVVAGSAVSGSHNNFAVVRYNSNGTLDTGFDTDGIVTTAIEAIGSFASSVALQSDGKIVAAGTTIHSGGVSMAVVRYNGSSGPLPTELVRWRMQISASISSYQDNENFAGVSDIATDGQDASFDIPEPPASPGNYVSLYFPHAEWHSNTGDNFADDIKLNTALADTVKRWYFQVTSNVLNDTVTLTFMNDRIPSAFGKYFTDLNTGKRINLKNTSSYKYYNTSAIARSFMLIIGDSTAPSLALTTPNGSNIWRSGTSKNISWLTSDETGIDTIFVYSSSDAGASYSLSMSLGFAQSYNWNVPSEYLNNNYSIKIIARDSLGNTSTVRSAKTFTVVGDSLATTNSPGWSLISVPLTPTDPTTSSIFDNSSYLWLYLPSTGFTQPSQITLGNGYFLGILSQKNWFVKGMANESDSSTQNLQPGYNIIGNNFVRNVSKNNLFFAQSGSYYNFNSAVSAGLISNALYGFTSSSYSSVDTMSLFCGYWIGVLQNGIQLTQKPNVSIVTPLVKQAQIFAMNWELPIKVSTASQTDDIAMIGIKQNSTADFDAEYDAPRPPRNPGNNYLEMYFTHKGGKYPAVLGSKYAKDFRDSSNANWDFTIENSQNDDITLSWNNTLLGGLSRTLQFSLKDNSSGALVDMEHVGSYTFTYSTPRTFSINAKTTKVEKNEKILPAELSLSQNYPNPFNPSTVISYQLPMSGQVSLIVYDAIGREVAALANEVKEAGTYSVRFDGTTLSSGIYFAKLTSSGKTQMIKLLLMK
ncbi:MAG: T9SS type A sorting domain-containing protein [Bacteroidota bacterium]